MKTITITKCFPKSVIHKNGRSANQLLKITRSTIASLEKNDARLKDYDLYDVGLVDKGSEVEMNFYYALK